MALVMDKFTPGSTHIHPWNILVEATVQGITVQGTITCHTSNEKSARRLACMTFINQLRKAGVWTHSDEIDEPYEIEVEGPKDKKTGKPTKKKEIKYKKVTRYYAPYWEHVKVIEILEPHSRDLTFPMEELEEKALYESGTSMPTRKRRTTDTVALDKRKKKQVSLAKKEEQSEKKKRAEANKQGKEELMRVVEAHFTGKAAKIIKVASGELGQTYQRIRYALFQIRDKGYNDAKYDLVQTEIDDSKAFRLVKQGKESK